MYEQIVDQIRQAIWSGDLPAGTPLSVEAPVRDVPLAKRCMSARASLVRVLAEAGAG